MPRLSKIGDLVAPIGGKARFMPAIALLRPGSVTAVGTGSSATINPNGSIAFSACTSLLIDNVFSSTFDIYQLIITGINSSGTTNINATLRSGGTTNQTNYTYTVYSAIDVVSVTSITSGTAFYAGTFNANRVNAQINMIYRPAAAENTIWHSHGVTAENNAAFHDIGGAHTVASSFDGLQLSAGTGTFTGQVQILGYRNQP